MRKGCSRLLRACAHGRVIVRSIFHHSMQCWRLMAGNLSMIRTLRPFSAGMATVRCTKRVWATGRIHRRVSSGVYSASQSSAVAELINYGSQPGQRQPSGSDHMPEGWSIDGMPELNPDPQYLGMRDLTSFCTVATAFDPGSEIAVARRVSDRWQAHARVRASVSPMCYIKPTRGL